MKESVQQILHLSWTEGNARRGVHLQTIFSYSEKFNNKKAGIILRKLVKYESKAYWYFLALRDIIKPSHSYFDLEHHWRLLGKLDNQAS